MRKVNKIWMKQQTKAHILKLQFAVYLAVIVQLGLDEVNGVAWVGRLNPKITKSVCQKLSFSILFVQITQKDPMC